MHHYLSNRDEEVRRLFIKDFAMRHKRCGSCKWADSNFLPKCRLKGKDVSTFQAIRANLCPHYIPYDPE